MLCHPERAVTSEYELVCIDTASDQPLGTVDWTKLTYSGDLLEASCLARKLPTPLVERMCEPWEPSELRVFCNGGVTYTGRLISYAMVNERVTLTADASYLVGAASAP